MENLADKVHAVWSHWMQYMFSCGTHNDNGTWTMPKDKVEWWRRQANTVYADLSENEKQSDRNIVKAFALDSDGYHSFDELYEFRKMYNAALFNEWAGDFNYPKGINETKYNVHKSWRHNDGELCFGGGWFIVVAILPDGQISNHYKMEDWDLFKVPIEETAKYPFDGHTGHDVLARLKALTKLK